MYFMSQLLCSKSDSVTPLHAHSPNKKKKKNPTHQTSKCAEKSLWLTLSAICVSSYVAVLREHTENPGDRSSEA